MSEAVRVVEQELLVTPAGGGVPAQRGSRRQRGPEAAFTAWVEQRCAADPGVRSALRRGAGKGLDRVPSMHRFVARWLPDGAGDDVHRAYYTVAAMIAAQRRSQYTVPAGAEGEVVEARAVGAAEAVEAVRDAEGAPQGAAVAGPEDGVPEARWRPRQSLGRSFAQAVASGGLRESSAETRLNLLSRQSVDGLHRHLPGAVRQLREAGAPVDWALLLRDLSGWRQYGGEVKRRWLQDFYRERHRSGVRAAREADNAENVGGDK
ncbi:type I-E CRISPR-associated protein Cse2/CasB [Kitasatospora sp. NPDC051984]|uniref:type I-E CRISPR-associated protein Cse2/CasB n=1 Tax=Kitasatospora sp. NPDC051984 TaxID=3364059 RepID=UPI0037C5C92F